MIRFLLTISILITVFTAGLGYFNKRKLDHVSRVLASTQDELKVAQSRMTQKNKDATTVHKQLSETTTKLEQTSTALTIAQENLRKATSKIEDLNKQIADNNLEMNDLKNKNLAQQNKILESKPSIALRGSSQAKREADWSAQLAEQKALVVKLQSQLENAQNRIQEYIKKDIERQKLQTRLGLEGKVLAVNQAWNFVVLSIGDKNGVTNNAEMLVKRGDQLVGRVRVTSVEPSSSIADIISSSLSKGLFVQPGDNVIYDTADDEK